MKAVAILVLGALAAAAAVDLNCGAAVARARGHPQAACEPIEAGRAGEHAGVGGRSKCLLTLRLDTPPHPPSPSLQLERPWRAGVRWVSKG